MISNYIPNNNYYFNYFEECIYKKIWHKLFPPVKNSYADVLNLSIFQNITVFEDKFSEDTTTLNTDLCGRA